MHTPTGMTDIGVNFTLLCASTNLAFADEPTGSPTADTGATDTSAEEVTRTSCCEVIDPDDPTILYSSWSETLDASGNPTLLLRTPDQDGLSLQLDFRLSFHGESVTWTTDPVEVDAYRVLSVDIDLPATAHFHEGQSDWLSTLVVRVSVIDSDDRVRFTSQAPRMRVAWDDEGYMLMDEETASVLAPGGAWSTAAADAVDAMSVASDDDFITTFADIY